MRQYLQLLRDYPHYTRLWIAGSISQIGDWFQTIVLLALIARMSGGSGLALSGYFLAISIPPIIVMPFAGTFADRFDRKRILIVSDILRALVVVAILLSAHTGLLWMIYILIVTRAALTAIFDPTKLALIPQVVAEDKLVLANTLSSISWSAMLALGAVLGGIVATLFGTTTALILDARTFIVSAVIISQVTALYHLESPDDVSARPSLLSDFRDGLQYAIKNPAVGARLFIKSFGALGTTETVMGIFATQIFVIGTNGEQSLSILYMGSGIGAILGPVLFNKFHDGSIRQLERFVAVGTVFLLSGFLIMTGANSIWLVAFAMMIAAMGGSGNWTYSTALIQQTAPNRVQGRLFSLERVMMQLTASIMLVAVGTLIDAVGAENVRQVTLIQAGILVVPLVIWIFHLMRTEVVDPVAVRAMGD